MKLRNILLISLFSLLLGVGLYSLSVALAASNPTTPIYGGGTGTNTSTPSGVPFASPISPYPYTFNSNFTFDSTNNWLKAPINDFGGQVYNVKAYGAKGDGSTNDTTAFNAATLAAHNAGAGNIFIPSGNFKLNTSPTLYNGVSMFGAGSTSLITLANGASINANGVSNISFDNFAIDGSAHTSAGNYGLLLTNVTNVYVTRMNIVNMTCFGIFINASAANTTDNVHIDNSYIQGKGNCDVIGGGPNNSTGAIVKNVFVTNNKVVQDCTVGTYCNAFDLVAETGFHVTGNTFYGIVQPGSEQFPHTNIDFSHNFIYPAISKATTALYVSTNASSTASSSFVTLAYNQIASGTLETFGVASGTVTNVDVSHNIITPGDLQSCIVFQYVSGGSVNNNQCWGGSIGIDFATSTNFKVDSNYLDKNNYGIRVDDISSSTIFSGINFITNPVNTKTSGLKGILIAGDDTTNSIPLTVSNSANNDTLRLINTSGFNRASLSFYDPSRNDPAGMFQIQDSGDSLTFYRGSLGTSARAKLSISSSANVIESGIGLQGITNGVFNGQNSALFQSAGTSFINSGSNFAIGTITPTSVLYVQASSTSSSTLFTLASTTGTTLFTVLGNANVGINTSTPSNLFTIEGIDPVLQFINRNHVTNGPAIGLARNGTQKWQIKDGNTVSVDDLSFLNAGATPLMTILQGGTVGINTTTPIGELSIVGSGNTSATRGMIVYNSNGTQTMQIRDDGRVGILGNPGAPLSVYGQVSIGSTYGGLNAPTNGIAVQGNAGFGTTTSQTQLNITGTISIDPFNISSTSGVSLLRFTQDGKLGIGTTVPASLLDVNGNIMSNGGSAGHATCWKADGRTIGYCSSVVDVSGLCTCN